MSEESKIIIYGKILPVRGTGTSNSYNTIRCQGKYKNDKRNIWGINSHLFKLKKGTRLKITIEEVCKEEFIKKVYT